MSDLEAAANAQHTAAKESAAAIRIRIRLVTERQPMDWHRGGMVRSVVEASHVSAVWSSVARGQLGITMGDQIYA